METSDNDIIQQMHSNPQVGMKLLMDQYQERLYWHIRRLVVSHADAQDLLQETFLKAYRSFDTFRGQSSLYSWLYRVATNLCLTHLRRQPPPGGSLEDVRGVKADDYFEFSDREALALQEAIHSLPPRQQAVFCMRYYDEMPFRQIAEANGTTENAAKANYHFAKTRICEILKDLKI